MLDRSPEKTPKRLKQTFALTRVRVIPLDTGEDTITHRRIILGRILQLCLRGVKVFRGDQRIAELLVANIIVVRVQRHPHIAVRIDEGLLLVGSAVQAKAVPRPVYDVGDMADGVGDLFADLVPMHEFVHEGAGKAVHLAADLRAETRAVGLVGDHGLVQEAFRLADVELAIGNAHVRLRLLLAAARVVIVIVDQGIVDPWLRLRIVSVGRQQAPVNFGDVGPTVGGGLVVALLHVLLKPAFEGIIAAVGDGRDGRLEDGRKGDEC